MQASELRIGNFIQDDKGNIQKVTPSLMVAIIENQITFSKPIPLTEEWLLKFGFVSEEYFRRLGNFTLKQTYDGFALIGKRYSIGIELEYVHQLQNLYFALTGSELEIKGSIPVS